MCSHTEKLDQPRLQVTSAAIPKNALKTQATEKETAATAAQYKKEANVEGDFRQCKGIQWGWVGGGEQKIPETG